ncbi:hypothetical protein ASPBRDRAFT_340944 [Aspergillus brasiliensis CBS 101740]|uniref:Uncharacterized protein n=1 Tax=Aspergillus brasiliensis (strain CBS 101740 / IMI 381727 / IBT 21946) TaxID=767769 RepID=A0A1L9U6V1_ASPBC|nr:hypothetical protein ASPBRDRAFT_340944 [Aspergillus brasiliensis CBS 101740]
MTLIGTEDSASKGKSRTRGHCVHVGTGAPASAWKHLFEAGTGTGIQHVRGYSVTTGVCLGGIGLWRDPQARTLGGREDHKKEGIRTRREVTRGSSSFRKQFLQARVVNGLQQGEGNQHRSTAPRGQNGMAGDGDLKDASSSSSSLSQTLIFPHFTLFRPFLLFSS